MGAPTVVPLTGTPQLSTVLSSEQVPVGHPDSPRQVVSSQSRAPSPSSSTPLLQSSPLTQICADAQFTSSQSTKPSPSLSIPSRQSSPRQPVALAQSPSAQSASPSPSLSIPSVQFSVGLQTDAVAQFGSAQSMSPSPSSSTPLPHTSAVGVPQVTSRVKPPTSAPLAPSTTTYSGTPAVADKATDSTGELVAAYSAHDPTAQPAPPSSSTTRSRSTTALSAVSSKLTSWLVLEMNS